MRECESDRKWFHEQKESQTINERRKNKKKVSRIQICLLLIPLSLSLLAISLFVWIFFSTRFDCVILSLNAINFHLNFRRRKLLAFFCRCMSGTRMALMQPWQNKRAIYFCVWLKYVYRNSSCGKATDVASKPLPSTIITAM